MIKYVKRADVRASLNDVMAEWKDKDYFSREETNANNRTSMRRTPLRRKMMLKNMRKWHIQKQKQQILKDIREQFKSSVQEEKHGSREGRKRFV